MLTRHGVVKPSGYFSCPDRGLVDETPDLVFCVRLGCEQDTHAQPAVVFARTDTVRRQWAWRLVIPVPAQRDRRSRSAHVGVRFHDQDRLMGKGLTHDASMRIAADERTDLPR